MSEIIYGIEQGVSFNLNMVDWSGLSTYQIESAIKGKVVKSADFSDKILTPAKIKKIKDEHRGYAMDLVYKEFSVNDYNFNAIRLGITGYTKLKPKYKPLSEYVVDRNKPKTKKGLRKKGYALYQKRGMFNEQLIFRAETLTEVKKRGLVLYQQRKGSFSVRKLVVDEHNNIRDSYDIGKITGERIGVMKSMPKTTPKSYIVLPEYLYAYAGRVTDAEYEWM
ncbi:MAG: hypothetical protein LBV67_08640 [Streptococcaceae bacterium]|jgi:hypothetical protein|nr:hypothetical protein [Streptococcaceae bacterium]